MFLGTGTFSIWYNGNQGFNNNWIASAIFPSPIHSQVLSTVNQHQFLYRLRVCINIRLCTWRLEAFPHHSLDLVPCSSSSQSYLNDFPSKSRVLDPKKQDILNCPLLAKTAVFEKFRLSKYRIHFQPRR